MYYRRTHKDRGNKLAEYTLSYAISVKICYVGYNNRKIPLSGPRSECWQKVIGTPPMSVFNNICAEASALSIALSYGEALSDLVFFAINDRSQPFNPCVSCATWIPDKAKGHLYFYDRRLRVEGELSSSDWKALEKATTGDAEDQKWYIDKYYGS